MNESHVKIISTNKKAHFQYQIEKKLECGICLLGTEIKSLRVHGCNLKEGYVRFSNNEVFVYQMEIPQYKFGTHENHEPFRKRKLLLHKTEILMLKKEIERKSYSCIPLKIYLKNGRAKVVIGIGKGKRLYDKRETIKKRDVQKEILRATKRLR